MIWRLLVLWSVYSVFVYVDAAFGRPAAWAAVDVLAVISLPLSKIAAHLAELAEAQRNRTASKETAR
jgi:hypothetical protein